MYFILKRASTASENMWSFYTEGGILYAAASEEAALEKMRELVSVTPFGDLRLMQQIDTNVDVTATVPEPEEPVEP